MAIKELIESRQFLLGNRVVWMYRLNRRCRTPNRIVVLVRWLRRWIILVGRRLRARRYPHPEKWRHGCQRQHVYVSLFSPFHNRPRSSLVNVSPTPRSATAVPPAPIKTELATHQ